VALVDGIVELASRQHGYVTTDDVRQAGLDPHTLRALTAAGRAEQRARGLYRINAIPRRAHDEYAEAVLLTYGQGALGGEAALDLWDLADVNPRRIHVAVPRSFRTVRAHPGVVLVKRDLRDDDIEEVDDIRVVSPAVAIEMALTGGVAGSLVEQAIVAARRRELIGERRAARLLTDLDDHQKGIRR
jgi:predicted transcriptional regulator of viral defense system